MSTNNFHFNGISKPNATMIPNEVLDYLMPRLTDGELRVVLYICRRTFGFQKDSDTISINQMVKGLKSVDGKVLDEGTGLSRQGVVNVTKSLIEKGVIIVEKRKDDKGENEINNYKLRFKGEAESTSKGVVNSLDYRSQVSRPTKESNTKKRNNILSKGEAKKLRAIGNEAISENTEVENNRKVRRSGNGQPTQIGDVVQARLANMHVQTNTPEPATRIATRPATNQQSRKPQGHWKQAPEMIKSVIAEWFSLEMRDQAKHSSITQAHRLYLYFRHKALADHPDETEENLLSAFYAVMLDARTEASSPHTIKVRVPSVFSKNGDPNRTPLFFYCLQKHLGIKTQEQQKQYALFLAEMLEKERPPN